MQSKAQWHWNLKNKFGRFSGYIDGIDPRDAVSRVLTQTIACSDRLFGEKYEVSIDFIRRAPGNFDTKFEVEEDGCTLCVQRLA
jgi:hypothetical protein